MTFARCPYCNVCISMAESTLETELPQAHSKILLKKEKEVPVMMSFDRTISCTDRLHSRGTLLAVAQSELSTVHQILYELRDTC